MTIELIDKNGNKLAPGTIPDGGKVRVPILLADAASPGLAVITRAVVNDSQLPQAAMHRPGSVALTDADRAARDRALDARDKRLVDAWKNPPALQAPVADATQRTTPAGDPWERRNARQRDAWKMGAR